MEDRDTKGDLYEYMLSKIASAGQNGQFRTPRHIIALMVEMRAPGPKDVICDPAAGTCGFLVAAGEYLRDNHPEIFRDEALRRHFHEDIFHGFDFDGTMLRIGSMNMILHGIENPDVRYKDSLAQENGGDADRYSLVLANPPFAGSLDYETTAKDLLKTVKTKKTELLFLALFLKLLKPGGRAAVIVPDGVLFGSSTAHKNAGRGPPARRHRQAALRRVPPLCGRLDRHPAVHQDELRRHRPGLVLRLPGGRVLARRQAQSSAAGREARANTGTAGVLGVCQRRAG
jgi:type I restriction enzyme M protein